MNRQTMKLNAISLFSIVAIFTSCSGQNQKKIISKAEVKTNLTIGDTVFEIGKNIRYIFQDSKNNYWYGSNDEGVYRYDGKNLLRLTDKHGLFNNQIRTIQEDKSGNIYFGTGDGVSVFDGQTFTTLSIKEGNQFTKASGNHWKITPGDLWFDAGYKGGVYRYDGNSLSYLEFPESNLDERSNSPTSPYGVYCIFKDTKGNVWFGTQTKGVCRYDGKSFTWFTEKGLSGPAVRAIFEDRNGNMWFGNNGYGLFCYDGVSLINFTEEKASAMVIL